MVIYLTAEEVLIIHNRLVEETGGSHGVRDVHRVFSAVERPKMQFGGKDLYPTIFDKAAVHFESIAFQHPFTDGNKRTSISVSARFLFLNGFDLQTTNQKLEEFVLEAVVKKHDLKKIADWFKKNSKKI